MAKNNKPNFFVVGFPRSGTSSLHYYFGQHPDIYVTENKELHYFANEVLNKLFQDNITKRKRFVINERLFLSHYDNVENERVITNFGPYIILSEMAAQKIIKFNKDAKILIMVRNPVGFLYSLHSQFKRLGFIEEEDLLKAYEDSKNSEI